MGTWYPAKAKPPQSFLVLSVRHQTVQIIIKCATAVVVVKWQTPAQAMEFVDCTAYLYFAELGNMLVQATALCFALALMALLCWESYLVEMVREYISLLLPETDVHGFIEKFLRFLFTLVSSLINWQLTLYVVCGIWCHPGVREDNF